MGHLNIQWNPHYTLVDNLQACIWVCLWWSPSSVVLTVAKIFFAGMQFLPCFSNRTRCQIYCLRVTWSILQDTWLYSLQLWLIVQVLVHVEWWPGSWACMGIGGGSCVTSGSIWIFALWRKVWPLFSLMLDGTVIASVDGVPFSVLFSQSSFPPSW